MLRFLLVPLLLLGAGPAACAQEWSDSYGEFCAAASFSPGRLCVGARARRPVTRAAPLLYGFALAMHIVLKRPPSLLHRPCAAADVGVVSVCTCDHDGRRAAVKGRLQGRAAGRAAVRRRAGERARACGGAAAAAVASKMRAALATQTVFTHHHLNQDACHFFSLSSIHTHTHTHTTPRAA